MNSYSTLIHKRVALANAGNNPAAIAKLRSGWVVLGDDQRLPGYCLLLADPVVDSLQALDNERRHRFLHDMSLIGDAIQELLSPSLINYSIYGNSERALHAHVHPRYDHEDPEMRRTVPFIYLMNQYPAVPIDLDRDKKLIGDIRAFLASRTEIIG